MYPRWIWRAFALPGIGWLIAFFLVAFYAIVATSQGEIVVESAQLQPDDEVTLTLARGRAGAVVKNVNE